jgi:hypothetical protein
MRPAGLTQINAAMLHCGMLPATRTFEVAP